MNNTTTQSLRSSRDALQSELQTAGAKFTGKNCTCPFHEDRHASGGVYEKGGVWRYKCQVPTCGAGGDIFDIRARLQNRDLADVLREASGTDPRRDEQAPRPKRVFASVDEIVASVGTLGTVEHHHDYTDPDTGKVQVVQVRYIEGEKKKFLTHHSAFGGFVLGAPPKPWPIYNRARVREAKTVVIVEGEKCVHALHKVGIVATTSLSGAANGDKADWSPLAGKKVYIWPDNDATGTSYAKDVITELEKLNPRPEIDLLNVSGLGLGTGGDVADLIEGGTTGEEIWCILNDGSEPVGAGSELLARIEGITSGKWKSFDFPGFPKLSFASKALFPGTITVKCADPAASKSLLLIEWFYQWHKQGIPVALMELEEDRAFHLHRLLAMLESSWDVLDDSWGRDHPDALKAAYGQHRAALDSFSPSLFAAPLGQINYARVLEWIEQRCKAGAKIIGIDPITAVYTGESRHIDDLSFIVKASTILRDYGARLILVTHPRMGSTKRIGGGGQDDLAGGRAFSRHTQTVLWLHRHDPPKKFLCGIGRMPVQCNRSVLVAKARNGPGHGWKIGMNLNKFAQFEEAGIISGEAE